MSKIDELKRERTKAVEDAQVILTLADKEKRDLTPEEDTKVDELQSQAEKLAKDIEREERQATLAASVTVPNGDNTDLMDTTTSGDGSDPAVVVGQNRAGLKPFETFGEQLLAIYRAGVEPNTPADPRLLEIRATGASESIPHDGGFLVQKDFSTELLRNAFETGVLASRVRRIPISGSSNGLKINAIDETSRVTGSRWGGIQAFWLDEGGTKTKSKPKFRQMNLTLQKLVGLFYATDELLEDSTALETVVRTAFAEEFGFLLDEAIFRGDGTGKPSGILTSAALVSIAKETGQAAKTIEYENIIKMYARLWGRSRQNAVWYINQDILPQLFNMVIPVGTGGVPVYLPANSAAGRPLQSLMGLPLMELEQADTLGTKGDIVLADLSQYLMIEKGGVKSAASIHVQFTTDETTFRFVLRVDGQPVWNKAITPFKGTNTLSPFVTLDDRA